MSCAESGNQRCAEVERVFDAQLPLPRRSCDMNRRIFDAPVSLVELRLDVITSEGLASAPLLAANARPSALKVAGRATWFGFIVNDRLFERIDPGQSVECLISFYNDEEAAEAFPPGASFLFGDCVSTRGLIRVRQHDVDVQDI